MGTPYSDAPIWPALLVFAALVLAAFAFGGGWDGGDECPKSQHLVQTDRIASTDYDAIGGPGDVPEYVCR